MLLAWAMALGVGIVPKSATPARIVDNWRVSGQLFGTSENDTVFQSTSITFTDEEKQRLLAKNRDKNYTRCDGWKVQ